MAMPLLISIYQGDERTTLGKNLTHRAVAASACRCLGPGQMRDAIFFAVARDTEVEIRIA